MNSSPEDIIEMVLQDAERLKIPVRGNMTDYRVLYQPEDFYSLTPGNQHLRPDQHTPVNNLYLAGDFTKQEHLSTMEGAVLSGKIAAELILN